MKKVRSKLHPTEIGVIKTFSLSPNDEIGEIAVECSGCTYYYNNLAELCEKWEDYEEPKKFWWINERLTIYESEVRDDTIWLRDACKQTGNYFLSREEAEKAIEKLKAWKRLKDKGFRFNRWTIPEEPKTPHIKLVIEAEMDVPDSPYDLGLLFGGEE